MNFLFVVASWLCKVSTLLAVSVCKVWKQQKKINGANLIFILWGKSGMYHHIWIQNYFGLIVSDLAYIHISGVFHVSWVISAIPLCYVGCASFCSKGEVMLKQFRVRNNMVRYFTHAMKQFNLFSFVSVVCVIAKDWYRANIGNMDFFFPFSSQPLAF